MEIYQIHLFLKYLPLGNKISQQINLVSVSLSIPSFKERGFYDLILNLLITISWLCLEIVFMKVNKGQNPNLQVIYNTVSRIWRKHTHFNWPLIFVNTEKHLLIFQCVKNCVLLFKANSDQGENQGAPFILIKKTEVKSGAIISHLFSGETCLICGPWRLVVWSPFTEKSRHMNYPQSNFFLPFWLQTEKTIFLYSISRH